MTSAEQEERPVSYQYDFAIDLQSDSTHANVIRLVGEDHRVLELGPASGYMSEILRDRGCTVVAVEIDAQMASQAQRFCERVIVGDLDTLDFEEELGDDRFDVILAADVLEHLKDPLKTLRALRPFLRPEGYFVASLPNIAHASVRLALLEGRFDYRDLGLLDRTHLRFFTRISIARLFDEAELALVAVHRQEAPADTTEIAVDLEAVPAEVLRDLERDPDARTYQFVIKAVPLEAPGMRELQSRLREEALARDAAERERTLARDAIERELASARDVAERELALVVPRLRELEEALAAVSSREGKVRTALIVAQDEILRRDEHIDAISDQLRGEEDERKQLRAGRLEVQAQREVVEAQLAARDNEARMLRVRLERIVHSLPYRIYLRAGQFPLLRRIVRRRTAGYEEAVQDARRVGR